MICPNCKNELNDDAKFCKFCGSPVSQQNSAVENQPTPEPIPQQIYNQPQEQYVQPQQPQNQGYNLGQQPAKKSSGAKTALIVILVLVIVGLLAYILFFGNNDKKSDTTKNNSSSAVTTQNEVTTAATTTTPAQTEETTTTTTTTVTTQAPTETTTTTMQAAVPTDDYTENVIGSWDSYAVDIYGERSLLSELEEQVNNGEIELDMEQVQMNFTFNDDGTFTAYTYTTGTVDGSWTINGTSIIIADPDGSNPIDDGDIVYDTSTDSITVVMTDEESIIFKK